jgi:hypothetical protein
MASHDNFQVLTKKNRERNEECSENWGKNASGRAENDQFRQGRHITLSLDSQSQRVKLISSDQTDDSHA